MKKFNKIKEAYTKAAKKATTEFKSLAKKNGILVKENNQALSAVKTRITQENASLDVETELVREMLKEIEG